MEIALSGGLTSANVIQHSADGTSVLVLVFELWWIIAVELEPFQL